MLWSCIFRYDEVSLFALNAGFVHSMTSCLSKVLCGDVCLFVVQRLYPAYSIHTLI